MTTPEEKAIITVLHEMEVRFTERLTRIEEQASAWRKTHNDLRDDIERVAADAKEAARAVATTQAADALRISTRIQEVADEASDRSQEVSTDCNRSTQRLTIGLVVVSILAVGRLGVNVFQMLN